MKNREFDQKAPQDFCPERATIAERQGASEDKNPEVKPTQSKTDFSSCFGIKGENHLVVSESVLKKVTGLPHPEGVAAEVALPPPGKLEGKKFLLALDEISDPGNLGTLLRTAWALGWEGAFLTPSSVDPFNDKAIRSAKGASFLLPLRSGSWEEFDALSSGMQIYVADPKGKIVSKVDFRSPMVLVLGNESRGLSASAKKRGQPISIPIQKMESLNVAIAGAILMYTMRPS